MCTSEHVCRGHYEFWSGVLAWSLDIPLTTKQRNRLIIEMLRGHMALVALDDILGLIERASDDLPKPGSLAASQLIIDLWASAINTIDECRDAQIEMVAEIEENGIEDAITHAYRHAIGDKTVEDVH